MPRRAAAQHPLTILQPQVLERPSRRSLRAVLRLRLLLLSEGARNVFVGSMTSTEGSLISSLQRAPARSGGSPLSISSHSTHTQLWPQPTKRTARGASKQILHSRRSSSVAAVEGLSTSRGSAVRSLCGASGVRRGGGAGPRRRRARGASSRRPRAVPSIVAEAKANDLVGHALVTRTWRRYGAGGRIAPLAQ